MKLYLLIFELLLSHVQKYKFEKKIVELMLKIHLNYQMIKHLIKLEINNFQIDHILILVNYFLIVEIINHLQMLDVIEFFLV